MKFTKEFRNFKKINGFTIIKMWECLKKQGLCVSLSTVRMWLYPKIERPRFPNYKHMIKISKIINISIDNLYGNCDSEFSEITTGKSEVQTES